MLLHLKHMLNFIMKSPHFFEYINPTVCKRDITVNVIHVKDAHLITYEAEIYPHIYSIGAALQVCLGRAVPNRQT